MIIRNQDNSFSLICDICLVTDKNGFIDFYEAVQYKKDTPSEWKSIRKCEPGNTKWVDVCKNCFPKEKLCNWKNIPKSKRNPIVSKENDLTLKYKPPLKSPPPMSIDAVAQAIEDRIEDKP